MLPRAIILLRPGTRQLSQNAPSKNLDLVAWSDAFGRHGKWRLEFVTFAEEDGANESLQEYGWPALDGRNITRGACEEQPV
ncbi:unnamed protein product [Spirodela intermedia]|uniref:Uncharacterized protein n=1 Tax=Spirodela intermedia TaxID=51605 RepID=A0A7I8IUT8_SPIIN|nr:unnamed protein product [Spirodela intermedia]CAA6661765.1 unnamed protein product [Spirodela intermedia]